MAYIVVHFDFGKENGSFTAKTERDVAASISRSAYSCQLCCPAIIRVDVPLTPGQSLILGKTNVMHLSKNSRAWLSLNVHVKETGIRRLMPNCATLCLAR